MSSPTSEAASSGFATRFQNFLSENKKAIIIGTAAAVLAAGGAAYYLSTTRPDADVHDLEKGEKKKDKKKSKGKKKKSSVKDKDGPILEEKKPQAAEQAVSDEPRLTPSEIAALSPEERSSRATALKASGNAAYTQHKFREAIDFYTRALEIAVKPEAVYFSNRAACYVAISPPDYQQVVDDCNEALKLDSKYVKALNRRATAFEKLGRYAEALRDFTAATILDNFRNESAAQSVERVLKTMATKDAAEILKTREPRLPSNTFISSYFAAFRPRPELILPEPSTSGDNTLKLAVDALVARDYVHSMTLVNEALEQDISWDAGRAEALNLRGTYKFLLGDSAGAKEDLEKSIEIVPSFTQNWVKLASVYMEQADPVNAFKSFDSAIAHDPKDPDIYYHRGQVYFIMGQYADAAENYTKSTSLDEDFVFSHIQLAVAQYKSESVGKSMATFRQTLKKFPERSEPYNYYGELLLDQQRFSDAVERFDKAIELEQKSTGPKNVLSLVNKGLALYQWKQDVDAAIRLCDEALSIDPECEAAIATLAQLYLQLGNIPKAVEMFSLHADIARTEPELINALTYKYASQAQIEFVKEHPDMAGQLSNMARAL